MRLTISYVNRDGEITSQMDSQGLTQADVNRIVRIETERLGLLSPRPGEGIIISVNEEAWDGDAEN